MRNPKKDRGLTTPDLVILSLLAERPMHGYEANLELERRQVREWAGVSRPQVYYSLEKLLRLGLIRTVESRAAPEGPERRVYSVAPKGRVALADALESPGWTDQRERPAFLTWIALSWQARPRVLEHQLERRRRFLEQEITRETATLRAIRREVGHPYHEAVWMVSLTIQQLRGELRWLGKVSRELPRRRAASLRRVPPA